MWRVCTTKNGDQDGELHARAQKKGRRGSQMREGGTAIEGGIPGSGGVAGTRSLSLSLSRSLSRTHTDQRDGDGHTQTPLRGMGDGMRGVVRACVCVRACVE